jgi:F-type H+-transporting ATPase subunit epsilon
MAMTIHTNIVSAEEEIFSGLAEFVVATGSLGDVGIAYGHAPLLTALVPGPLRVRKQGGEEIIFYVSGGYLEVQQGEVNILADTALRGADLDEAAASQAQKDAAHALQNMSGEMDFGKAAGQLAAAAAQLRTLQQLRKKMGH